MNAAGLPARQATLLQRRLLIAAAFAALAVLVIAPVGVVLVKAFQDGLGAWTRAVLHPDTRAAFLLTLGIAVVAVPLNAAFGLAAAYLCARRRFPGRLLLLLLSELPFSVPPVLTGLFFVLLLGPSSALGAWLGDHGLRFLYTPLALVLTTLFVTFSFVLRTVLPVLQGGIWDEEEAAQVLGASPSWTFLKVTLPRLSFALANGILLLSARAIGEFGAVSVVSGRIRGLTNSLPLQVEAFYFDQDETAAFAAATLLVLLALGLQAAKWWLQGRAAEKERA